MLDVEKIRRSFPALNETFDGRKAIFFDNPGGTQVHRSVIDAMRDYLVRRNANLHGGFITSRRSDETVEEAHRAGADLLGCDEDEIVFGNNMTSLTFQISRSLARDFRPGDEIVVTRLDHDANIRPWIMAAEERGARVRWVDIDVESATLDMLDFRRAVGPRTKLVAIGYASNATGTVNPVQKVVEWAREWKAITFVDAVQYAPHRLVDVKALGCDFLACSAYKFFGPHTGMLFGRREQLQRLPAYRVLPAGEELPGKWETGTQNLEGMAGTTAAINYLSELGVEYGMARADSERREKLRAAWEAIEAYERRLSERLIRGLQGIPGVRIYGLSGSGDEDRRVPTVALRKSGTTPADLAAALHAENIFCWHGNFYAQAISERMGVEESGGFLRLGLVHYNTVGEVDRCLQILESV